MEKLLENYQFRNANNGDSQTVSNIIFTVLDEYGLQRDDQGIDADLIDIESHYKGGVFKVLLCDETIIGSYGIYKINTTDGELRKMYLKKEKRGEGLGHLMLKDALDEAKHLGFERLILETASVLKEAIQLYAQYGFRPNPDYHLSSRCDQSYSLELL